MFFPSKSCQQVQPTGSKGGEYRSDAEWAATYHVRVPVFPPQNPEMAVESGSMTTVAPLWFENSSLRTSGSESLPRLEVKISGRPWHGKGY